MSRIGDTRHIEKQKKKKLYFVLATCFASSLISIAKSILTCHLLYLFALLISSTTTTTRMVQAAGVDYCYSDIGCFPLSAEFYHPKHRPFNVRPLHRRHIRTQFELFNRHHPEGFMLVPWDRFNLVQSRFDPRLETKIIIPGWLDNINRAIWVRKLKDALLWLWAPTNIIVVRWTNFTPYTVATANTRVVGAELANLMKFLEHQLHYDPAYYHIIGHSLGAHIAGYCGDRVHGLGRITALDPARPFFQHMPKSVRLDRGDAKFIDAIHSDFTPENAVFLLMSYGMTTPVGHLDFYPNGPPLFQPGCMRDTLLSVQTGIAKGLEANSLSVALLETTRYLTACDHQRSHEWFIESITNRECAFVGVRCDEFEGMINGRCTCDDSPSACAIMGINADQMYLNNVHEELWPVRAGSIDYKYKSKAFASQRPLPPSPMPPPPPAHIHHEPTSAMMAMMAMGMQQQQQQPSPFIMGPPIDMDHLGQSADANYNLLAQSAALATLQGGGATDGGDFSDPTKEEIYTRLKQELEQAHAKAGEPSSAFDDDDDDSQLPPKTTVYSDAPRPAQSEAGSGFGGGDVQAEASGEQFEPTVLASHHHQLEDGGELLRMAQQQNQEAALNDQAFVEYLRANLLAGQMADNQAPTGTYDAVQRRNDTLDEAPEKSKSNQDLDRQAGTTGANKTTSHHTIDRRSHNGHYEGDMRFRGHPALLSNMKRDIESWYEDNVRWHLKTNNRPQYCSNQYQLLIYLGALKTSSGRDRLRANLMVSIIGTRGQLLNQRFIPRGSILTSYTMQPFFILLEGSYSLGQIKSVALAWEARTDPDPVKATVTFQSSAIQQLGQRVPAYKAKQFPWLPEETEYDHTQGFSYLPHRVQVGNSASLHQHPLHIHKLGASSSSGILEKRPRMRRPFQKLTSGLIAANVAGTYSDRYTAAAGKRRRADKRSQDFYKRSSGDFDHSNQSPVQQRECSISDRAYDRAQPPVGCSKPQQRIGKRADLETTLSLAESTAAEAKSYLSKTESQSQAAAASATGPESQPEETGSQNDLQSQHSEQSVLVDQLSSLKQAEQRDQLEALRLLMELREQQLQQQHQQALNQTYVMPPKVSPAMTPPLHILMPSSPPPRYQADDNQESEHAQMDMSLTSSDSYFVPVVDPPDEPSVYVPKPGLPPEALVDHEGEVTLDLHNVEIHHPHHETIEDSIVINQVVVSPLQATYGRYGRSAKTFCPPQSKQKQQMLTRDQTIQLTPTFMTRCHDHPGLHNNGRASYHLPSMSAYV